MIRPNRGLRDASAMRSVRTWRVLSKLPARVVLRADRFRSEAPWLSLALLRATSRRRPLPQVVAVEVDLERPLHATLLAGLLLTCDPTPTARAVLRAWIQVQERTSTARPLVRRHAREAPRDRTYARLQNLVRRRPSAGVAWAAARFLLATPPRTPEEIARARTLCRELVTRLLPRGVEDAGLPLAESFLTGAPMPRADYCQLHRSLGRDQIPRLRLVAALAAARQATASGASDAAKTRALGRAEDRARRAREPLLAAGARIVRRYVSWNRARRQGHWNLIRAFRTTLAAGAGARLWLPTNHLVWTMYESAGLSRNRGRLVAAVLRLASPRAAIEVNVAASLYGPSHIHQAVVTPRRARLQQTLALRMRGNRFPASFDAVPEFRERLAEMAHHLSFGILGAPPGRGSHFALSPAASCFLQRAWALRGVRLEAAGTRKTREGAVDAACVAAMQGRALTRADLQMLQRACASETTWSRRLIVSMVLTSHLLARGEVRKAARACAEGRSAWMGLHALRRRRQVDAVPAALHEYEACCRRVLAAFEPPIAAGRHAVRTVTRVVEKLPRHRAVRPRMAVDALDAVITAGRSAPGIDLERRVVDQLARMLHARVLFHRVGAQYLHAEPQAVNTLSSWTLRRLACSDGVVASRIKPRPEFWLPEQQRPGGVISFDIGSGRAAIARRQRFTRQEMRAVRTVLRFLAERYEGRDDTVLAPQSPSQPARSARPTRHGLIGSSNAWTHVLEQVWKTAPTPCAILVRGETGTGKELVARAIHKNSRRAQAPFVPVNCAAVHAETMLSELFGHVRGSFTGATQSREGLVRRAHGGTLFLDEVGDMPGEMQVALLRTLEERTVLPVGGTRIVPADIRLVSATNRNLEHLVSYGAFREDLLHRVNTVEIRLPPLRERLEDLPELVQHILGRMRRPPRLHMDALPLLARHTWPGNVRELHNVLRAADLHSDGRTIRLEAVERALARQARSPVRMTTRLAPRAEAIVRQLRGAWMSAPELAQEVGVSARTINRELSRLISIGLVESLGQARARRYRAADSGRRDLSGIGRG